jgi:hypothetical protein
MAPKKSQKNHSGHVAKSAGQERTMQTITIEDLQAK